MKISRNFVMDSMATIAYFAAIIMIGLQLYEPLKSIINSETGHFWSTVALCAFALVLAIAMPIFCGMEAIKDIRSKRKENRWFMFTLFVIITFAAYPLIVHTFANISYFGLNPVQFKEFVSPAPYSKNNELGWFGIWYTIAFVVYGVTAMAAIVFGSAGCLLVAVLWGWDRVLNLVINPLKENNR